MDPQAQGMHIKIDTGVAHKQRTAGLWAVAVLFGLVYYPTMAWLVHRWSLGVWYHTHGFAVPVIAAWLAYRRFKDSPALPRDASAWGFAFLLPAVALQIVDALLRFELLSAVSLVLIVPGLSLLFLGRAKTRALWFPLLFLGFAVPIPLVVVTKIHFVLRHIAAAGTGWTLDLMGYDIAREGTLISIGPESVQIADACSGFSTLMALLMAGVLLAYLAAARGWRAGLFLALVYPIAAFANVLRCIVLCMLIAAFGPDILNTWVHPVSGVCTFIVALGILFVAERFVLKTKPAGVEA